MPAGVSGLKREGKGVYTESGVAVVRENGPIDREIDYIHKAV